MPTGQASLRDRLHHVTWAWYTLTMSTGGIGLLLHSTPHQFPGLPTIGIIIFILNLVLFTIVTASLVTRFVLFPGTLSASITHPTEGLFIPTFLLTIATLLTNIQVYGVPYAGPWLVTALRVLFWLYLAISFLSAVAQYHILFVSATLTSPSMTPSWVLPAFPSMLVGTIASTIAASQPVPQATPILVAGLAFQAFGFLVSVFMFAIYINRLMTAGLPVAAMRPGMFIAVGPPAYTALAFIGMANAAADHLPGHLTLAGAVAPATLGPILRVVALLTAIALWPLALWFFSISLVATLAALVASSSSSTSSPSSSSASARTSEKSGRTRIRTRKLTPFPFHLTWYCFVFPNVGFAIATISIGSELESAAIAWVGSAMTIVLVAVWLGVMAAHARAVWTRQVAWPGKDEDADE